MANQRSWFPQVYAFLFLLILALALFLRFYCLSCSSLWHDEGNTWALMSRSFADIARAAAADIHPPGYYWLLKVWTMVFGSDVIGLRSFSAAAGVATVAGVYAIARMIGPPRHRQGPALLAALVAALNPFLIFYSQEARMYSLLALEGVALFGAVIALNRAHCAGRRATSLWTIYFIAAVGGLWTHYSFAVLLAAAMISLTLDWVRLVYDHGRGAGGPDPVDSSQRSSGQPGVGQLAVERRHTTRPHRSSQPNRMRWDVAGRFVLVNAAVILAFLPWLPTAVTRVMAWPAGGEEVGMMAGLRATVQILSVGPLRNTPDFAGVWLILAGLLPLLGLVALRRSPALLTLTIWLVTPIVLMFGLGLFSEAFLKFLIVAAPVWCVLVAALWALFASTPPWTQVTAALVLSGSVALPTLLLLPGYYEDAAARDNYAGIARTVAALGEAESDLVLLDAPGQAEVWQYYDPGLPVLALPQQRPAAAAATRRLLADVTADRQQIFALFWAVDEADPDSIVEHWLDQNAFKGSESWQGNVRFVRYSLPNQLSCAAWESPQRFDDLAELLERCQSDVGWQTMAGESLLIGLRWRVLAATDRRFKVTIQLLDSRNQVIAQRDGEPAGGSRPTVDWRPGDIIQDNHALFIPIGTPPGLYRLIVALYDGETGERLPANGQDFVHVAQVDVQRGPSVPVDILPIQHRLDRQMGPVALLGYDAYPRGYAHAPETPLNPGDLLHITLYWQAPDPLPADWPDDLDVSLTWGDVEVRGPLAGGLYPTGEWTAGALVRGEFDIPYQDSTDQLQVSVQGTTVQLGRAE